MLFRLSAVGLFIAAVTVVTVTFCFNLLEQGAAERHARQLTVSLEQAIAAEIKHLEAYASWVAADRLVQHAMMQGQSAEVDSAAYQQAQSRLQRYLEGVAESDQQRRLVNRLIFKLKASANFVAMPTAATITASLDTSAAFDVVFVDHAVHSSLLTANAVALSDGFLQLVVPVIAIEPRTGRAIFVGSLGIFHSLAGLPALKNIRLGIAPEGKLAVDSHSRELALKLPQLHSGPLRVNYGDRPFEGVFSKPLLTIVITITVLFLLYVLYLFIFVHPLYVGLRQRLNERGEKILELDALLKRHTQLDPLTGAYTRRHLLVALVTEMRRAIRSGDGLTVFLLEIIDLENINEKHGEKTGDQALIHIGHLLHEITRETDVIGRYSGSRFLVVMPGSTAEHGNMLAQRLKQMIVAGNFSDADGQNLPIDCAVRYVEWDKTENTTRLIERLTAAKVL